MTGTPASGPGLFDGYARDYEAVLAETVAGTGFPPGHFQEYKVRIMASRRRGRPCRRVLDFGCGIGLSLPHLRRCFPEAAICAVDPSARSVELARARWAGLADVEVRAQAHEAEIPFPPGFDLVLAANVLHHVPPPRRPPVLAAIRECLAPGGELCLFEHNPWNPLTARAVRRCPLDREAVLLAAPEARRRLRAAGFAGVKIRFTVFFPGWLRPLLPLEPLLGWVPLGAQYYARGGA